MNKDRIDNLVESFDFSRLESLEIYSKPVFINLFSSVFEAWAYGSPINIIEETGRKYIGMLNKEQAIRGEKPRFR
ncbi:hypothetical protein QM480_06560 [Flectobacillus sp. DC10W]|uniref:Uncharacterized protein n=1 Tax=Flectobacillus longus TaxID=2984207 RepID=A0ABT6YK60_9BACT|nr:hypothetical protein [Flectobacillus longus]MDI9863977.1 hypothetical protein [Flectobacillus longus]